MVGIVSTLGRGLDGGIPADVLPRNRKNSISIGFVDPEHFSRIAQNPPSHDEALDLEAAEGGQSRKKK